MSAPPTLPGLDIPQQSQDFPPQRAAGLARLAAFAPRAGRSYAGTRNYDFGPDRRSNVSILSPYLRHRMVLETEVLRATLARHSPSAAEKFIQEVFWRAYFKGWLEQHPQVWLTYRAGLFNALDRLESDAGLTDRYRKAAAGATGIEAFDAWISELTATGYLHNHARMWTASIWIFTLGLPWELGADLFLRHLIDGDPASNTLSWRWVAGLHTKGKTYLARPENIEKYTSGRFAQSDALSKTAPPLTEDQPAPLITLPGADPMPEAPYLWLVTEEDMMGVPPDPVPPPAAIMGLLATPRRSPLAVGGLARDFAQGAMADALARAGAPAAPAMPAAWGPTLIAAANDAGVRVIATSYPPIGPSAEALAEAIPDLARAGIVLHRVRRRYDAVTWPHATKGFFALKKQIPRILTALDLAP